MSIQIEKIIRSRRKTIALVIERDGTLTVRAPMRLSEGKLHAFVEQHATWITKHQHKAITSEVPKPKVYQDGESFLFLGQNYPLVIAPLQRTALLLKDNTFSLARHALPKAEDTFIHWYKAQAARIINERVKVLSAPLGLTFHKVRISSARTRWGSCSSRGTLSFTWRLVMAPPEVVDYVVMHELVHTRIKDHSKSFYLRLGQILPEYKTYVHWLKQNGKKLTL